MGKNRAFTLVELAIMGVIILVLLLFVLQASNPFAHKFNSPFYDTFKRLRQFSVGMLYDSPDKVIEKSDNKFCSKLISGMNFDENSEDSCSMFYSGSRSIPFAGMSENNLDSASFILQNGQRFYLSTRVEDEPFGYRVISVDLNGEDKPNKFNQDVVSFLVFDNGEVLPIGVPADSENYLKATVKIYDGASGKFTGTFLRDKDSRKNLSYRRAFCSAGYSSSDQQYCATIPTVRNCVPGESNTFCRMDIVNPTANPDM